MSRFCSVPTRVSSADTFPVPLLHREQVLRQIFGPELDLLTSTRERNNDLFSLCLVCRSFLPIAQAALLSNVTIRAEGRGILLRNIMTQEPHLASLVNGIIWTMFSNTSSPALLAQLIKLAQPTSLSIGHGFFRTSSNEASTLTEALYDLGDKLQSFTFGSFDTGGYTSSDFISHHLTKWSNLTRLDLWNVSFVQESNPLHDLNIPLLQNTQWEKYSQPTFQLKHLGIHWTRRDKLDHWKLEDVDWLDWLLSSSRSSLQSLKMTGLDRTLPEPTLDLLTSISSRLQDLYISNYTGPQLLADIILHEASNLYTLTLGGDIAYVEPGDNSSIPTLATSSALENKRSLRCLEIHDLLLFDRLNVLESIRERRLPALRQITLLNASRVYLPVQKLVLWCRGTDISVVVRPP